MARSIGPPAEAKGSAPGRGRLTGRRIVVVGAGSLHCPDDPPPPGNGRAIAILCAREGASVACVDINAGAADETVMAIKDAGAQAFTVQADVTDAAQCERLVRESAEMLGGLDGLVLNVGLGLGRGLAGTTPENWDYTFAVNLRSHFLIARAAMESSPPMSIVFVGSVAGLVPGSGIPAYDSSKAGLAGLCRHVAYEGARSGVRANVVVPGLIDTPLGRIATAVNPNRTEIPLPLGRQGTAWEIAYAAVFLLSDEASYITGQQLVVDGGLTTILG